jgi:hypothetical protein
LWHPRAPCVRALVSTKISSTFHSALAHCHTRATLPSRWRGAWHRDPGLQTRTITACTSGPVPPTSGQCTPSVNSNWKSPVNPSSSLRAQTQHTAFHQSPPSPSTLTCSYHAALFVGRCVRTFGTVAPRPLCATLQPYVWAVDFHPLTMQSTGIPTYMVQWLKASSKQWQERRTMQHRSSILQ